MSNNLLIIASMTPKYSTRIIEANNTLLLLTTATRNYSTAQCPAGQNKRKTNTEIWKSCQKKSQNKIKIAHTSNE